MNNIEEKTPDTLTETTGFHHGYVAPTFSSNCPEKTQEKATKDFFDVLHTDDLFEGPFFNVSGGLKNISEITGPLLKRIRADRRFRKFSVDISKSGSKASEVRIEGRPVEPKYMASVHFNYLQKGRSTQFIEVPRHVQRQRHTVRYITKTPKQMLAEFVKNLKLVKPKHDQVEYRELSDFSKLKIKKGLVLSEGEERALHALGILFYDNGGIKPMIMQMSDYYREYGVEIERSDGNMTASWKAMKNAYNDLRSLANQKRIFQYPYECPEEKKSPKYRFRYIDVLIRIRFEGYENATEAELDDSGKTPFQKLKVATIEPTEMLVHQAETYPEIIPRNLNEIRKLTKGVGGPYPTRFIHFLYSHVNNNRSNIVIATRKTLILALHMDHLDQARRKSRIDTYLDTCFEVAEKYGVVLRKEFTLNGAYKFILSKEQLPKIKNRTIKNRLISQPKKPKIAE